jgi:superfamily II DNA/RNA helicase
VVRQCAVCCAQELPFRSAAFTGSRKWKAQVGMLKDGIDVAVCTPGRLLQLLNAGHLCLDDAMVRFFGVESHKSFHKLL